MACAAASSLPSQAELPLVNSKYTVQAAYAAIPHRRTVFEPGEYLTQTEREYLQLHFAWMDQAIRWRVGTLEQLVRGNPNTTECLDAHGRPYLRCISTTV